MDLTTSSYTRPALVDQHAGLEAWPPLPGTGPHAEPATLAATGTEGAEPRQLAPLLAVNLRLTATSRAVAETPETTKSSGDAHTQAVDVVAVSPVLSGQKAERTGFEPVVGSYPDTGLANRRYRPLSHLSKSITYRHLGSFPRFSVFRFTTANSKNVAGTSLPSRP